MKLRFCSRSLVIAGILFAAGCAATAASNSSSSSGAGGGAAASGAGGSGGSGGTGQGSTTSSGASMEDGGLFDAGSGSGGGPPGDTILYAHTDTTLFQLDPKSPKLELTEIGDFDCIGALDAGQDPSMTDFAVDKDLNLWGISATAVHKLSIQGKVVHCDASIALNNPTVSFYALTFAPAGVLDPDKEVLVAGNSTGELWAIDDKGNLAQRGSFGLVPDDDGHGHAYAQANRGKTWELSGDIVFLANEGNPVGFATVRDCPAPPETGGCNDVNTLIEIDVKAMKDATTQSVTKSVRGQIVKRAGCNDFITHDDYGNMYGIAAWNATVYGFSRAGNLVAIDTTDGSACLVHDYPLSRFAGAGVTTLAPIIPPPN